MPFVDACAGLATRFAWEEKFPVQVYQHLFSSQQVYKKYKVPAGVVKVIESFWLSDCLVEFVRAFLKGICDDLVAGRGEDL